ncbi:NAD(P)H-dependent glycerol-3-phosphate dehydrogenase [Ruminococcus flavefaciens]|uniref:NAD(P)H-dependent glycerol-3-phosphate dehydrogenase n=1 Tax=Ruminococcus flavefaciens TaxID=1265 RepID=UPI0026F15DB3|nr:NAD(P)H-dependent glycerol-3-phosphate dehydrogenase [Ruminococcus flavefaciens]MDD7516618.1 NAD(P)-dependent glycerol-3-phosphate dehydrogenase [Ruminococcus flavefaciens]MDY5691101.1 NAD(P)H-dependent glycerol-3-phosphate dehydrogenase [Ruminococcus flavefaciens]
MANIVILGSGGFGLSLAIMAEHCGKHNVTVWSKFQSEIDDIRSHGEHIQKLPGVPVSESIAMTSDISCVKGCDMLIFGIPSSFVRDVAKSAAPYVDDHMVVVNTGKGLEEESLKTLSQVIGEEIKTNKLVVLSGPSHAEEVARCVPTTIVAASENHEAAEYVQREFGNNFLRIYLNDDVKGCEIGGAMKNIIALCVGICDGLGYGDNTKAALMTRGIHEIARLGKACGANTATFSGLTGIGDLIVTCTSMHSRNRRAGILIGQGVSPEEAVKRVGTVEGYFCCKAAYELSRRMGVEMPITEQLNEVLFNGGDVRHALGALMNRPQIYEEI